MNQSNVIRYFHAILFITPACSQVNEVNKFNKKIGAWVGKEGGGIP